MEQMLHNTNTYIKGLLPQNKMYYLVHKIQCIIWYTLLGVSLMCTICYTVPSDTLMSV